MTEWGGRATLADMDLSDLDRHGAARLPALLSPGQCAEMIALWEQPRLFLMVRHGVSRLLLRVRHTLGIIFHDAG